MKSLWRISAGRPAAGGLVILAAGLMISSGTALAAVGDITAYPIPTANSNPDGIARGPEGNLWFTEYSGNKVAKVTTSGVVTEYPIPTANSNPQGIAAGPDGNLWFTEKSGNKVAKVTTSGAFTEYPIPTAISQPQGIAAGSDGNLWFTEQNGNQVAKVTTSGSFTEYPVPTANSDPLGIAAGPDGNLWFTELAGNQVAKVTTSGSFTEYPVLTANSAPLFIAAGPDGNLWFGEINANHMAKVTTSGVVTEYPIPTANSDPQGIAAGPDGNLWFTEYLGQKVAKVTTSGAFTEYFTPTGADGPGGITVGPDGNLWFTETSGNHVAKVVASTGRLRVVSSPAVPTQILVDGQIADSWGLTWLKEDPGAHTVCFAHVEGWTEPPCQNVTVSPNATTTVNGTFVQRGSLRVVTSPAVASEITVDGIPRNDWGMFTDIPVGAHTVCFGLVKNFTPPACQPATVTAGGLTTITGTFTSSPGAPGQTGVGSLRVVSAPALRTQITVDGNIADSWGLTWLELPPGPHTVCFTHIEGYTEPACSAATVTAGATIKVTGTFTQRGTLRVITSPAVAGTISVDGIPRNDWGMWTDLATGSHVVCFGAATGFANTPACQTVTVNAGLETDVTGTYS